MTDGSADLVLERVELKRSDVSSCDAVVGNGDCEEFEAGAALVSLKLGTAAVAAQVTVNAPPGMYDAREFKIHKPSSATTRPRIRTSPISRFV